VLAYFFILILVAEVLFFPLDFYSGYTLEHKYGLSNQSVKDYFLESFKGFGLGLILNSVFLLIFYYLLHNFSEYWWLIGFFVVEAFMVVLANLAPTIIFPLFYKFTPLEKEALVKQLTELSEKNGVTVKGIFEMDMSKNTKKANAALTGIGNTRRIILSDTLINEFTEDEIETIIAHELGHKNHNHMWKLMGIQSIMLFSVFYLSDIVLNAFYGDFGYRGIDDIAALPLLVITLTAVSVCFMPVVNSLSRYFEVQADTFALNATHKSEAFISAMERLAVMNLADKEPHPLKEFIFHSHPSIRKRVAFAKNFQG